MTTSSYSGIKALLPLAVVLLGFTLRLASWGDNRFLEDEALYAYWGLQIATGTDPMLDLEPLDKPPVFPYVLSASQTLLAGILGQPLLGGASRGMPASSQLIGFLPQELTHGGVARWIRGYESASRLPSLAASVVSLALLYALGARLFRDWKTGALAALLLALSPFDILFASTAFVDPLMTALVLGALLAAATSRLGASGLLIGLAAASKQQGLLFLPLVVALGLLMRQRHGGGRAAWVRFLIGFGGLVIAALAWDQLRVQRPGFIEQGFVSYGGLGTAQPEALLERAVAWLALVGSFWLSRVSNVLMLGALVAWFLASLLAPSSGNSRRRTVGSPDGSSKARGHSARFSRIDLCLLLFVLGYLALHWLVGFQLWDRYLLALVPLVALLAARAFRGLDRLIPTLKGRAVYAAILGALLLTSLAGPLLRATRGEVALGGDHGAYDGIDDLAAYIRTQLPPDSVLYHYWLGYHYRFYLYGAPLRTHWYPTLEDLTRDAYVYRHEPRYIAFPSWEDDGPAHLALMDAGVTLSPVTETRRRDGPVSFRLYRMEGP